MQVWRLNDTEEWIPVVRRISEDCGDELRIRLVRKVHLARYDILGLYEDLKRQYNAILELGSSLTENRARLVN